MQKIVIIDHSYRYILNTSIFLCFIFKKLELRIIHVIQIVKRMIKNLD